MISLYSKVFQDFLRARLDSCCSLPYKWHPSQPQNVWQGQKPATAHTLQLQSKLLRLPRELRDEIYQLVLGEGTMVHVSSDSLSYHPPATSENVIGKTQDDLVYTNDLYFDQCLESSTERQVYSRSLQDNSTERSCRYRCGSCKRHEHCADMRGGMVFETALMRLCRQVNHEASIVMWKTYVFSFELQHTLTTFAEQLSPLQRQSLKSLHLSMTLGADGEDWIWDSYDLMATLASLPSLRNLHLSLKYNCRGDFEEKLQELQEGSLALWKDQLGYLRRPSVKDVTITIDDYQPCDLSKNSSPRTVDSEPPSAWTKAQRARFADALKTKLLSG